MRILSLFSGCGGLDLGFKNAGFEICWANEFDKKICPTHDFNFPDTTLDSRSIRDVPSSDMPSNIDGVIGGPPCQAFSEAGKGLGVKDARGQLFFEYLRVIDDLRPKFFMAENVSGMLHSKHKDTVDLIYNSFKELGYHVNFKLYNANDFGVPQDRKRVIFVGYRDDVYDGFFSLDDRKISPNPTLKDAIWDLKDSSTPGLEKNWTNGEILPVTNHEYFIGSYSTIYMSRNRVRSWDEPSFTIQAGGRHAPIHPQAPKMPLVSKDNRIFEPGSEHLYRRLSIRECARVQTFPDSFEFKYKNLAEGYKMIGNAVPVKFAQCIAEQIKEDLNIDKQQPLSAAS